jgi:hypothetical protein
VLVDDQRVDIELAQLRQFAHHFRYAQQQCSMACMSTAGAPRHSPSVSATRARAIRRCARNWFSGGSSTRGR